MDFFQCSYLGIPVELNDERENHIEAEHDELLPNRREYIASTLDSPDRVQISPGDPEPESLAVGIRNWLST